MMEEQQKMAKSEITCACGKCENKADFFHSKCCNAHFEGVISDDGTHHIICEKCGKYSGMLLSQQMYDKITELMKK